MNPDKIDALLHSNPKHCHDCGRGLSMACMVIVEGEDVFVVCRLCAIKRDPNDRSVMDAVTEYAIQAHETIARRN